MYSKIIDAYISAHTSGYQSKYCYHSCDRLDETTFKFHYYVRDPQLLQINIFLEIHLGKEVEVKVLENLHEQEQWALACDALNRIRGYTNRKTTIPPGQMEAFVGHPEIRASLSPQDMINVLNYIEYHQGKNPDSIYLFYKIFLPYLEKRLKAGKYREAMQACDLLFDEILYEVFWYGINVKYLDQEHLMHQAYIRAVFNLLHDHFETICEEVPELMVKLLVRTFQYWRFAFAIYSSLEKIAMDFPEATKKLFMRMDMEELKNKTSNAHLVFEILCAVLRQDETGYRKSVKEVLKLLMGDIISLANPEEQEQTGIVFLKQEGFDILLEIFDELQDSYIYSCFPISDIPEDLHPYIKKQLEDAMKHYAEMMTDDKKRMEALNQITNINTLLIENF